MSNYSKLEIDSEIWPKKYWDHSLRCIQCDVRWPMERHFFDCPQCNVKTAVTPEHPPDMRWPEAVKILLEERFEVFYKQWKEDQTIETLETFDKIVENNINA